MQAKQGQELKNNIVYYTCGHFFLREIHTQVSSKMRSETKDGGGGSGRGGGMVKNQELGKQTADCRRLPDYRGEPKVYRKGLLKDECSGSYLLRSSGACFHIPRQWQLIHALPLLMPRPSFEFPHQRPQSTKEVGTLFGSVLLPPCSPHLSCSFSLSLFARNKYPGFKRRVFP